jgi:hypothetical protein
LGLGACPTKVVLKEDVEAREIEPADDAAIGMVVDHPVSWRGAEARSGTGSPI